MTHTGLASPDTSAPVAWSGASCSYRLVRLFHSRETLCLALPVWRGDRPGSHRQCMFEVFKFFLCGHRTKLPSAFVPRSCFRRVSLDSLHTYIAYEFGIVGGSERERRIGASGFRRTLEIAPGSGKIADIDHLLPMRDQARNEFLFLGPRNRGVSYIELRGGTDDGTAVGSNQCDA